MGKDFDVVSEIRRLRAIQQKVDAYLESLIQLRHCPKCGIVFSRKGRQLYCGTSCRSRSRPIEERRQYIREYMRKRRANLKGDSGQ